MAATGGPTFVARECEAYSSCRTHSTYCRTSGGQPFFSIRHHIRSALHHMLTIVCLTFLVTVVLHPSTVLTFFFFDLTTLQHCSTDQK